MQGTPSSSENQGNLGLTLVLTALTIVLIIYTKFIKPDRQAMEEENKQ